MNLSDKLSDSELENLRTIVKHRIVIRDGCHWLAMIGVAMLNFEWAKFMNGEYNWDDYQSLMGVRP